MKSYLTKKVLLFQKEPHSTILKRELVSYCQIIIYTYPVTIKIIEDYQAADLLLYVLPRIETLLLTFTYNGIPFENYIKKIAFLQAHSFVKMIRKEKRRFVCDQMAHEDIEYFFYTKQTECSLDMRPHLTYGDDTGSEELMWSSESPVSLELKKKIDTSVPFKKRIIHLILLCSDLLSPSHISFLAEYLKMEEIELAEMISNAIVLSDKRITLQQENKRIRDSHFFEKEFLQREKEYLVSVEAHPFYIERVEKKLEKESRFFYQMNSKVRTRPTTVTHQNAGKVTGVPKGTVDSGLQSLFNYLKPLVDENLKSE
ncbi:MAG: hypothetical protein EOM67_05680 [Spirochaetia bacterium]|nr:hypothetical protein [Spirochaetia bacterium]